MFNEKKKTIKEDWFVGSKMNEVKVDALTRDNNGAWWSKPQNNQQQLPYDSTGNSSVSLKPSNSSYFYQVPGTMQSSLPPRIIPEGLSNQVQWNLPQVPNMAAEPFNPMSLAKGIQCPVSIPASNHPANGGQQQQNVRENYDNSGNPTADAMDVYNSLQKSAGSGTANRLPIPTMVSGNAMAAGDTPIVNYDRFIVANLNRNRGNSDNIRGDLFITPILPDSNTNSLIMFRPSSGTEVLNTGAMAVLTGAYNETNAKTANLAMAGNSGALNTFSGVAWARPESSSVGLQIASNADMLSQKTGGTTNFGDAQTNVSMTI
jgi:hypothetical protein